MSKKNTKKALFSSVVALILCFSMLVGTTFAWFTDEVESGLNTIVAGNLDVELEYKTVEDGALAANWAGVKDATEIFDPTALWEPGRVEVVYLKVSNLGTLALKYQLGVNFEDVPGTNVYGDELKLSEHLVFKVVNLNTEPAAAYTREEAIEAAGTVKGLADYNSETTEMEAGDYHYVALIVYMPTTVGNEANYKTGTTAPQINLGINLYATQLANEEDSFGPDYDEDAWHPDMVVTTAAELAKAIAEVKDGGIIALADTIEFNEDVRTDSGGGWYEGLNYVGDKSFTIDLNGYTITNKNGTLNDRLLRFENNGTKPNTITIKNGTLDAVGVYSAVATAGSNAQKITINLENVNVNMGDMGGSGAAVLIRGGAELNVNAGTVITAANAYCAIECTGGATANIYDGAQIYQNGTSSYCGSLVGASGNGTVNVYGGYGKSAEGCFIAMTSGGTINVSGGEWIANTDGTPKNDNYGVLIAQNDKNTYTSAKESIINVTGGTFKGGYNCYSYTVAADAQINISAGNFNADPTYYVADNFKAVENNGVYYVVSENIVKVIATAADLAALGGTKINGTYLLVADIDMTGYEMKPIAVSGSDAELIFLGNGHTISNLTLVSDTQNGMPVSALFNVWYSGKAITVNDLTIKNATSTCDDYSAVVVAYNSYAEAVITLNNVDVVGAKVNGATAAGLVGYTTGVTNLTDCDVSDLTLNGEREDKIGAYIGTANTATCAVTVDNCTNNSSYRDFGRVINGATWNGGFAVSNTEQLINAIKNAPADATTTIVMADGTYAGDIDITVAALGQSGGNVVIKAMAGAKPVITGTVTLGYRNQGVGATMYNANVTFEGITFDHAEAAKHSIDVQDVKSLTLKNCIIIGDGEYGLGSARGNATGTSKIVGCTFENAGMQLLGNFATGLVIDGCTFNESRINIQAGNGVTVQECVFNNTLTDANVGDSFYAIRTNSTPITVKDCEFNIDSKLTEVATAQTKWYLLANRGTTNWTVENVKVTLTDAALAQTALKVTACTSTGMINTTNLTVNGVQQ